MGATRETATTTPRRLGEILQAWGQLTPAQLDALLAEQRRSGLPLGKLAERRCGVRPEVVVEAWIQQYLSYGTRTRLADQALDPAVRAVLSRRQAWQFGLLPLRREDGMLILATSRPSLPRAAAFAWNRLREPVYFLILSAPELEQALRAHYPFPSLQMPALVVKVRAPQPATRLVRKPVRLTPSPF